MGYVELRNRLQSRSDIQHGDGATESQIVEASRLIGTLPSDYANFLQDFGWLMVGPQDVYGLGDDVQPNLNVVRMTQAERSDAGLPDNLIAIHGDGGGNYACIDCEAVNIGTRAAAIVFWAHDNLRGRSPSVLADSFTDWLTAMIDRIAPRQT